MHILAEAESLGFQVGVLVAGHYPLIDHVRAQEDPILRADDVIFRIAGEMDSGVGDLSTNHDRYLCRKDWQEQPQGEVVWSQANGAD